VRGVLEAQRRLRLVEQLASGRRSRPDGPGRSRRSNRRRPPSGLAVRRTAASLSHPCARPHRLVNHLPHGRKRWLVGWPAKRRKLGRSCSGRRPCGTGAPASDRGPGQAEHVALRQLRQVRPGQPDRPHRQQFLVLLQKATDRVEAAELPMPAARPAALPTQGTPSAPAGRPSSAPLAQQPIEVVATDLAVIAGENTRHPRLHRLAAPLGARGLDGGGSP